MKRLLKHIFIIFVSIIMGLFVLNILIDNPYTHSFVQKELNTFLKKETNLTVTFEAMKIRLLTGGVELYGVKVDYNDGKNKENIYHGAYLGARISINSLFLGKPKLANIFLKNSQIKWPPEDFKGIMKNPSEKPEEPSTPVLWPPKQTDIPLEKITIENSRVNLQLETSPVIPKVADRFSFYIDGASINIEINDLLSITQDINIERFDLKYNKAAMVSKAKIKTKGFFKNQEYTLPEISIKSEEHDLKASFKTALKTTNKQLNSIDMQVLFQGLGDLSALGAYLEVDQTGGKGHVIGDLTLKIPLAETEEIFFNLDIDAEAKNATLAGFKLLESTAKLKITDKSLKIYDANIRNHEQKFGTAEGELLFNDAINFAFDIKPQGLPLNKLLDILGVDFNMFSFDIYSNQFKLTGTAMPFLMDINTSAQLKKWEIKDLTKNPNAFGTTDCNGQLDLKINIEKLNLKTKNLVCKSKASINSSLNILGDIFFSDKGLNLSINANSFDLATVTPLINQKTSGLADFSTKLVGPYEKIVIENKIKGQNIVYEQLSLTDFAGTISIINSKIAWEKISASTTENGLMRLNQGNINIDNLYVDTDFDIRNIKEAEISKFFNMITPDLQLSFNINSLQGNLSGFADKPGTFDGQINANITNLNIQKEKIFDQATFKLLSKNNQISSEDFEIVLGNLKLQSVFIYKKSLSKIQDNSLLSKLGLNGNDDFIWEFETQKFNKSPFKDKMKNQNNQLAEIPFLFQYIQPIELQSLIELKGRLDGKVKKLQGAFQGKLNQMSLLGSTLAPLQFKGTLNGGKLDLTFDHAGKALKGRLSTDLSEEKLPYEWYFSLDQFDLRPFATKYFFENPRNFMYITANWSMSGYFKDWWKSKGSLEVQNILARYDVDNQSKTETIILKLDHPKKFLMQESGWSSESNTPLVLKNADIEIKAQLANCRPPENFNLDIVGILDAKILQKLSKQVESSSGKIVGNLNVQGEISNLKTVFSIKDLKPTENLDQWQPLSIGIANIRPPLKDVDMEILYNNNTFIINRFVANKGSGKVNIFGLFNLNENAPSSITLEAQNAEISYPIPVLKYMDSTFTGTVNLFGYKAPYKLTGDIKLDKVRAIRDFDIRDQVVELIKNKAISSELNLNDPFIELDINVNAKNSIDVVNRNMKIKASTNLHITGTDVTPVVLGQTLVDEGKFNYKQEFELKRAVVTFDDPVKIDPNLDILASSEVSNYRVFINVTGKSSNPVVEFSIDPATREDGTPISSIDILLLLSRGSLPQKKNTAEANGTVTAEAATIIVGQFEQPLENLFQLSNQSIIKPFYVDFYASETGSPLPRGNIPIHLGKDTDLIFSVDSQYSGVAIEYPLHESISVSGKYKQVISTPQSENDSKTDTGVDLKFKFSFP